MDEIMFRMDDSLLPAADDFYKGSRSELGCGKSGQCKRLKVVWGSAMVCNCNQFKSTGLLLRGPGKLKFSMRACRKWGHPFIVLFPHDRRPTPDRRCLHDNLPVCVKKPGKM
jgi:hypothetical protein